ncbi:hypothetical protein [Anaeromyxobacter sp. SG17]|uniref:hypothetical protein n=1 Tax=Anaeromyxobacter sp. SG17 TaxID=2925405 RepID=UPI001F589532|nr:hypothetical protein [Anaeromyxobacter sp. SG17]
MLRRAAPALLVAVALAAGCRGCGCREAVRGAPAERFLPPGVRAAVLAPELGRAASDLAALHATAASFPGAGELAGARGALASQLGFDPLDGASLAGAGLDPRRAGALALAGPGGATPLLVLPVSDAGRVEALLARLARERLGAAVRSDATHGGQAIVVLRRAAGAAAALSYAIVERTALVAPGPDGPAVVAEAAALTPETALGATAAFGAARAAAADGAAALVYVPGGSALLAELPQARDGLGIGLSATKDRLHARAALLAGGRAAALRALEASGSGGATAAHLRGDAAVVLRWDGDPAALGERLVPLLPEEDRARLAAHGVDLRRDLFGALAPGAAVALAISPRAAVSALSPEALRADPLQLLELEAILPVKVEAEAALRRVAAALAETVPGGPRRGGAARSAHRRGGLPADGPDDALAAPDTIVRMPTASGEIAWRLEPRAHRLVLAAGAAGRLDALLARLGGEGAGFRAPTPGAEAALAGGLGGAVVDVQRLVSSVRALPPEAFGTGPSGFVVRALAERFLEPAARLRALSLETRVAPGPGGAPGALVLDLDVEARAPEATGGGGVQR